MGVRRSAIGYCDFSGGDANFVVRGRRRGECEVSAGCEHCYARAVQVRFGVGPEETTFYPARWRRLLRHRFVEGDRPFRRPGGRPLVFVCDTGDWLHPRVPGALARHVVRRLGERADVDWLLLTKRAERLADIREFPPNVWPGVTVERQAEAWRVERLLSVPAAVHWVSVEPMLGPVDLTRWLGPILTDSLEVGNPQYARLPWPVSGGVEWVVCGGESGPERRPFGYGWARDLRDQCAEAGVPFFFKQGSGLRPGEGAELDGREYREMPGGAQGRNGAAPVLLPQIRGGLEEPDEEEAPAGGTRWREGQEGGR